MILSLPELRQLQDSLCQQEVPFQEQYPLLHCTVGQARNEETRQHAATESILSPHPRVESLSRFGHARPQSAAPGAKCVCILDSFVAACELMTQVWDRHVPRPCSMRDVTPLRPRNKDSNQNAVRRRRLGYSSSNLGSSSLAFHRGVTTRNRYSGEKITPADFYEQQV